MSKMSKVYDIVDINHSNFGIKKASDSERTLNKSSQLRQESPANNRVSQNEYFVNQKQLPEFREGNT